MDLISKTKIQCPIAMKWIISDERLKEVKEGEYLTSKIFDVSHIRGLQYYFEIYPNDDEHKGEAMIYLYCNNSENLKIEATFNINVDSANWHFKQENYIYENFNGRGKGLCKTDELFDAEKRFFVDGKMTVTMDGTLFVEKETPIENEKFGDHRDILCLGLWKQDESKDFIIISSEKSIKAHKCVLSTYSPVFTKMFESKMKESVENKVEIKDFEFEIIEKAIKLLYHHSLVPFISIDEKYKLLQFFDKYEMLHLKDNLENHLITVIDELNVCRLTNCSIISNARKLEEKCEEFLQKCLHERKPINDFDLLDKDFAMNLLKNAFYPVSE